MGFYAVLYKVNKLIEERGWRLQHCRRCDCGDLRYYVTANNATGNNDTTCADCAVLTPLNNGRKGLTLAQLLQWLAHLEDKELVAFATAQQNDPAVAA